MGKDHGISLRSRASLPLSCHTPLWELAERRAVCSMWRAKGTITHNEAILVVEMAGCPRQEGLGTLWVFPLDLGASGQHSIHMQGPEMLPDNAVPHWTEEQSLKHQPEAQPEELSLEERAQCSRQQPLAQLSHRPKKGPQLWPKRGE